MATADIEVNWPASLDGSVVYTDVGYGLQSTSLQSKDLEGLPTIVVESQGDGANASDAPIVIFPNDPTSSIAAEEIVMEEQVEWMLPTDAEEEVVIMGDQREGFDPGGSQEEMPEIPLNDETYATYHPFPCDFCCRRFKKRANLMNHLVAHQTVRPHGCVICSSRFMRKCDLVNHMKIHSYVPNRENRSITSEAPAIITRKTSQKQPEDVNIKRQARARWYRSPSPSNRGRKKAAGRKRKHSECSSQRTAGFSRSASPDVDDPGSPKSTPERSASYVDEDVKLLLEMRTKLHKSSESGESSASISKDLKAAVNNEKPYICGKCHRKFARESALNSHLQVHAEDTSFFYCSKCGMRFFAKDMLKTHMLKKHDKSSLDSDEESPPEKGYTGDERFGGYSCEICSTSFHCTDQLKMHIRILHPRTDHYSGLYRCPSCSSTFLTKEKLLTHLDETAECQQHVCLICGEPFPDQGLVQTHIKLTHGRNLPPNTCDYCGKQARTAQALRRHIWTHQTDSRYRCKESTCQKMFSDYEQYKRHLQLHSRQRYVTCADCDERFPDRRALINHRHTHSSSGRRFICNECGKSFGSRSSQQIHMRIHTGERPYGCRYCWKAFADGGTLRKHERIHTGEKPYACVCCPRAFNQRVVLREHIRSHHTTPTSKLGRINPVFLCVVCEDECSTPEELALHLVNHSDTNTRLNRRSKTGIRPYRRRDRQVSVEEIPETNSDTESAEEETSTKRTISRLNNTIDLAVKNIDSIVEAPKRAKMINTKLQPSTSRGRSKTRGRGRKMQVVTSQVVAPRPRTRRLSGRLSTRRDSANYTIEEDGLDGQNEEEGLFRPRTKNVGYDTLRLLQKGLEEANRPDSPTKLGDKEIEEVVKKEDIDDDDDGDKRHRECGICKQRFGSKADLLFHVPNHI